MTSGAKKSNTDSYIPVLGRMLVLKSVDLRFAKDVEKWSLYAFEIRPPINPMVTSTLHWREYRICPTARYIQGSGKDKFSYFDVLTQHPVATRLGTSFEDSTLQTVHQTIKNWKG